MFVLSVLFAVKSNHPATQDSLPCDLPAPVPSRLYTTRLALSSAYIFHPASSWRRLFRHWKPFELVLFTAVPAPSTQTRRQMTLTTTRSSINVKAAADCRFVKFISNSRD